MRNNFNHKTAWGFFGLMFLTLAVNAQVASIYLDINNVKADYIADGRLFRSNNDVNLMGYFIPKDNPKKELTISNGGLMIGGFDENGLLHASSVSVFLADTIKRLENDFLPGPLNIITGEAQNSENWNRIWKVTKSTIDYHKANYQSANYIVPQEILDWPGNGPVGCSPILAPFFDRDGDGLYEPHNGDYPIIKGDQAVFFIFNDNGGAHNAIPGGATFKTEIHGMAWARVNSNEYLNNATFLDYTIFNRSSTNYYKVKTGLWLDLDIVSGYSDYLATDTSRNMVYGYNPDSVASNGTGSMKLNPVQGLIYLDKKLHSSMPFFDNSIININGFPKNAIELNRYLNGLWADGTILSYGTTNGRGGTQETKYAFSGDVCSNIGWHENDVPGDRMFVSSINIDTLKAGGSFDFNVAFVYARGDSGVISSACKLKHVADYLQTEFNSGRLTGLNTSTVPEKINIFPNPLTSQSIIELGQLGDEKFEIIITDLTGKIIRAEKNVVGDYTLEANGFASGMYILKVVSMNKEYVSKFIVN